jgi:serine/threonine protein kinase
MNGTQDPDSSRMATATQGPSFPERLGDDFEVTGVVGTGGFSVVYSGWDRSLQRTVAIKEYMPRAIATCGPDGAVIPKSPKDAETFRAGMDSFLNEACLLAQFTHPALVHIYRVWEQNGTAYIAMQYCEGKTLREVSQSAPAMVKSEGWLKTTFAPILDALELLHAQNCFHRDISPDNIVILQDGEPILLDFGAARQIIGDMTQSLTVVLKPGFAPIEQYADDTGSSLRQGPWTDVYGVGAVLYYLLMGKPPMASIARLVKDPVVKLAGATELAGISRSFREAIDHALTIQPSQRIQSIAELREALQLPTFKPATSIGAAFDRTPKVPMGDIKKIPPPHSANRRDLENVPPDRGPPEVVETPPSESTPANSPGESIQAPHPIFKPEDAQPDWASGASIENLFGEQNAPLGNADPKQEALQPVAKPEDQPASRAETGTVVADIEPAASEKGTYTPNSSEPDNGTGIPARDQKVKPAEPRKSAVGTTKVTRKPRRIRNAALGIGSVLVVLAVAFSFLHKSVTAGNEDQHIMASQAAAKQVPVLPVPPPSVDATTPPPPSNQASAAAVLPQTVSSAASVSQEVIPETVVPKAEVIPEAVVSKADVPPIASASKPVLAASSKTSAVHLSIKPWGKVSVDGQSAGISPPLINLPLTPGQHVISITNGDYPEVFFPVVIHEGKDIVVSYQFDQN